MTTDCTHNPRTARIACGQSFGGELQHCVAPVSWSRYPDGLAHVTASLSVIERMWSHGMGKDGNGEPTDPAVLGFTQDASGRWRSPAPEAGETRWATTSQKARIGHHIPPESDETPLPATTGPTNQGERHE